MARKNSKKAVWEGKIVRRAIVDSIVKLDPRHMMGNPVMFVVEVGSVITTVLLFRGGTDFKFNLQITLWLWFTVLFANFAEAMAEGRGKAQADTLRKARSETVANRVLENGTFEQVPSSKLRAGDIVMVSASEMIPSDGEIIVVLPRWMSPRSRVNRRPSSVKPAATVRPSPAEHVCSLTKSG